MPTGITPTAIYPVAGGRLLVRDDRGTIRLIGADGSVRDTRTEPSGLRTANLIFPFG